MADTIKIGNLDISAFKVGSSDCKIYLGDTLVYTGGTTPPTPPTPSFQGKWKATYSGGTTSSAECDSSSAITQNEINKTNLVSAEIGDCVTTIGNAAFASCTSLTSCTIGSGVTSIGGYAFQSCTSLTSCTIGSGVTSIGVWAFRYCSGLTSVDIPDSVTNIGDSAFRNCSGLISVTIGTGVTSIGSSSFRDCTNLQFVTIKATTPPTLSNANAFNSTNNCPIYVPSSSVSVYKSANNWSSLSSRIQAIPNS